MTMSSTTFTPDNAPSSSGGGNGKSNGTGGYDMSFLSRLFTTAQQEQQDRNHQVSLRGSHSVPERIESSNSSSISSSGNNSSSNSSTSTAVSYLPVEVSENEKFIRLKLNVTGVKPSDIKVDIQRGILLIRGNRKIRVPDEGQNGKEVVKSHNFSRRYAIDTDVVDANKIRANLSTSGVLTITGPKKSAPSSIQVEITENSDSDDEPVPFEPTGGDITPSVTSGRKLKQNGQPDNQGSSVSSGSGSS